MVRARREFANQSTVGLIVANTARSLNTDTSFLPGNALAGGIDWDWRLKKRYALQGYWAGSTIHGTADAIDELQTSTVHSFQRPDADHLDYNPLATSLNGYAASVALAKIGGSKVRFNSNVSVKSPGLDLNDLGFMQRADVRSESNWIQFRRDTPTKHVRNFRWNLNQWGSWNYGGDRMDLGGNVNAHWQFTNNWRTGYWTDGVGASVRRSCNPGRSRGVWHSQACVLAIRAGRRQEADQRRKLLQPGRRSGTEPTGSAWSRRLPIVRRRFSR